MPVSTFRVCVVVLLVAVVASAGCYTPVAYVNASHQGSMAVKKAYGADDDDVIPSVQTNSAGMQWLDIRGEYRLEVDVHVTGDEETEVDLACPCRITIDMEQSLSVAKTSPSLENALEMQGDEFEFMNGEVSKISVAGTILAVVGISLLVALGITLAVFIPWM